MIDQLRTKWIAHVEERFMPHLALAIPVVLMVSFVVRSAFVLRRNLEELIPVESDAKMPECRGCKSIQLKDARIPRQLIKLPIEVTQDKIFNNRGLPVFLCEFCDEYELAGALEAHQKRIDNK